PFMDFLLESLLRQGLDRLVFLLGFAHRPIVLELESRMTAARQIEWSIEQQPLGTAGALKSAERFCADDVFLVNGDTYLDFDAEGLIAAHARTRAAVTLAAARVPDAGRYGALDLDADGRVRRFREKSPDAGPGLINGGIYVIAPRVLDR